MVCGTTTIFTAPLMRKFEARSVLIFSGLCCSVGSFIFLGSRETYYMQVLGRGILGLGQAVLGTYAPVWINEFAPKDKLALWLGLNSLASIAGAISGNILGSIAADSEHIDELSWFKWQTAIAIPAGAFLKLTLTWYCCRNEVLDSLA